MTYKLKLDADLLAEIKLEVDINDEEKKKLSAIKIYFDDYLPENDERDIAFSFDEDDEFSGSYIWSFVFVFGRDWIKFLKYLGEQCREDFGFYVKEEDVELFNVEEREVISHFMDKAEEIVKEILE